MFFQNDRVEDAGSLIIPEVDLPIQLLLDFFFANMEDLKGFFKIEKVSDAIKDTMEDAEELERLVLDFPYTEQLDGLFHPLSLGDNRAHELTREKARNWAESSIRVGSASTPFASSRMCTS